ncbi:hypothetical protein [Klebsiella pneumoniae]|uniref:hypothetical protein n=1 Tax=Klebsiella pneumoniae TaxID=573 RepID=UPI000E3CB974
MCIYLNLMILIKIIRGFIRPELPVGFSEFFTAKDEESGEILPFTRYRITTGEGKVFEGRTDAEGKTVAVYTALPDALHIELL